jgi:uncharacterized protein (DUF697 family)
MLVPVQVGMIAGITATYGLAFSDGFLSAVLASTVPGTGATIAGRSIVAALFKLIPGPGTLVGIAISATTAVVVTTAFGEAYIRALEALFVRHGGEPAGEQEVLAAVKRYFTGGGGEPPGEQKGPAPLARQFTGGGHGREDRRWYQLWK